MITNQPAPTTKPTTPHPTRRRPLATIATAITVLAATISCTSGPDDSVAAPTSVAPTVEDYPIVWLPTPYLDLNSPDGTFIRAAFESSNRQKNLGNAAYYPGFRHASLSVWLWYDKFYGLYSTVEPPNTTYVWAAPFPDPDPDPQGWHDWTPLSRDVGGIALCSISTNPTVKPDRLFFTYRRTSRTPPTNQHGPHPAPTTNVFGSWKALDFIDTTHLRAQRCNTPPRPLPAPTGKSVPGWPSASQ